MTEKGTFHFFQGVRNVHLVFFISLTESTSRIDKNNMIYVQCQTCLGYNK